MDQFEKTVVNPNISLNNFEVKIREHEEMHTHENTPIDNTATKHTNNNYKAILLLVILSCVFIYQVTVIL